MSRLLGEIQFWHALSVLLTLAGLLTLVIPALSELLARGLHSHAVAVSVFYRLVAVAGREYRRVWDEVMEETGAGQ